MNSKLSSVGLPSGTGTLNYPVRILIPGRLPSWNQILAMEHWQRHKYKQQTKRAFELGLLQCASDCLTRTTSVKNTWLTSAATPGFSLTIVPKKPKS
jgi:hypothetical protein